jgi:hypothetical protein
LSSFWHNIDLVFYQIGLYSVYHPYMSQHNWFVNWNAFQVTNSWCWLRECQECAKLPSRQRVATLKNLKYRIYFVSFNTFLVTSWFHMCYFIVLMSSLLFYNVENSKIKKTPGMSRCDQTFVWYCL